MEQEKAIKIIKNIDCHGDKELEETFRLAIDAFEKIRPKFSLVCLRCKSPVGVYSDTTMAEAGYTKYSYCENCLRKGLKLLKESDDGYVVKSDVMTCINQFVDNEFCAELHKMIDALEVYY